MMAIIISPEAVWSVPNADDDSRIPWTSFLQASDFLGYFLAPWRFVMFRQCFTWTKENVLFGQASTQYEPVPNVNRELFGGDVRVVGQKGSY